MRGVRLDRLTAGRCDRVFQNVLEEESVSKGRHARAVSSLNGGYAVRDDVMPSNSAREGLLDAEKALRTAAKDAVADAARTRPLDKTPTYQFISS